MLPSQLTRRGFLASGLGALTAYAAGDSRPNILFLFPDQLRAQALGCMGNSDVKTPHMDRLASQGLLMENTLANTPVCCPARANILTGNYAHKNGMIANDLRLRESHVTLAETLGNAGYRTGFIGKWHLDGGRRLPGFVPPGPRRQGFQFWAANECSHSHFKAHYFRDTDQPIPFDKFEPEVWTDLGIEFLNGAKADTRPFFLSVQMGPPHNPYIAPPEYSRRYDPARITMRPNWRQESGMPGPKQIAEYYAMTTAVDDQIGRMVARLDELGLGENTIVMVSSDHGDMLGSQGLPLKRKPWEESIHVPGIVRYPKRVKAGRRSRALFTHVDFAPTLLGLCGVKRQASMQGADLSRVITGESGQGPDAAFFQIFGPYQAGKVIAGWRGVRTGRYMYARYENAPWVLYDLEQDPYQLRNLVEDHASQEVRQDMERRLAGWMQRTGDSWRYNWSAPYEDGGRLYNHETFYTLEDYEKWLRQHPGLANPK
ncbi:MAG: sulfatase [Acidobacteriia bacterium]|nr:sulfatase [Terriglobia bacterium]